MKNNKAFTFTLKHDLYYGTSNNIKRIGLYIFIFLLLIVSFIRVIPAEYKGQITLLDLYLYIFKGILPISANSEFELPLRWLTSLFTLTFILLGYVTTDLSGIGLQCIVRSPNRSIWWFCKQLWGILTGCMYWIIAWLLMTLAICLYNNNLQLHPSNFMMTYFLEGAPSQAHIMALIIGPILTSMTLLTLQLLLELCFGPIISYILIGGYLIIALYIPLPIFIGNFFILQRYQYFFENSSITLFNCLLYNISLSIFCVILGTYIIRRKNIISR
ncbi:hypothetical protein [Cellulosilyticum ruminicola]|uniref:hypothetical protein n=1 Tax=Cellulosilyticum ruminicola TaxID=425254 RepID=UPI0006D1BC97|nr:hypothetical protein [Cellulosilyticum ruminicola]